MMVLVTSTVLWAADFSGRYEMSAQGLTFVLNLREEGTIVNGNLLGANGMTIQLQGAKINGLLSGRTSANGMTGLFQGALQGEFLQLTMMDIFPNGAPNYATGRRLVFKRAITNAQEKGPVNKSEPGGKVENPNWNFTVRPSAGWIIRQQQESAILGHNEIAGMILLVPHTQQNKVAMNQEMSAGLNEQNFSLTLQGKLYDFRKNGLFGDYKGLASGQAVKAQAFGILLKNGGGAYVIALAAPGVFSTKLTEAAAALAKTIEASPKKNMGGSGSLAQHFVGTWKTYTKYSERTVWLYPNGTYRDSYTASYGGGESPGAIARDDSAQGRWSVNGTKEQGTITFSDNSGSSQIQYRVHVKNGHTYYSEYFFDGVLYGKQ